MSLRKKKVENILIALTAIINLFFSFLPLTADFNYESAVLNSLVFFLISCCYHYYIGKDYPVRDSIRVLSSIAFAAIAVGLTGGVFFSECNPIPGIKYFLVFALPSLVYGAALGAFTKDAGRKHFYFIVLTVMIIMAIMPLAELYFLPQVYFFNPLITFFPGTIYEKFVPLTSEIIYYKAAVTLLCLIVLVMVRMKVTIRGYFKIPAILTVFLVGFFLKQFFGFSSSFGLIEEKVGLTIKTENFKIVIPGETPKHEIDRIAFLHEYYLSELEAKLDTKFEDRIISVIFRDNEEKYNLFGSRSADIAKPWMNAVFLVQESLEDNLLHELAHVVLGKYSNNLLKIASGLNPGLTEGYAVWLSDEFYGENINGLARRLSNKGNLLMPPDILSYSGFFSGASSVSYLSAGAYVKFLYEEFGSAKIKYFYGIGDEVQCFGENPESIWKQFRLNIETYPYQSDSLFTARLFAGTAVYKQKCIRRNSELLYNGRKKFNRGQYLNAMNIYSEAYSNNAGAPALYGLAISAGKCSEYEIMLKAAEEGIQKYGNTYYYYLFQSVRIDALNLNGRIEEAYHASLNYVKDSPEFKNRNSIKLKSELIKKKELSSYLKADKERRFVILKRLNTINLFPESLPELIRLEYINTGEIHFSSGLIKNLKKENVSEELLLEIAEMTEKYGYYNISEELLEYILNITADKSLYLKSEKLKKRVLAAVNNIDLKEKSRWIIVSR